MDPVILFVAYFDGCNIDSPAALFAAKWITQSKLSLSNRPNKSEVDNVVP